MSFTYDLALTSNIHKVRLLLGDTDIDDIGMQDEEITFFLAEESTIYQAAAAAAVAWARRLQAGIFDDQKVGETRIRTKRVSELLSLAEDLRRRGRTNQLPSALITVADKEAILQDNGLLRGSIERGMHDWLDGGEQRLTEVQGDP